MSTVELHFHYLRPVCVCEVICEDKRLNSEDVKLPVCTLRYLEPRLSVYTVYYRHVCGAFANVFAFH